MFAEAVGPTVRVRFASIIALRYTVLIRLPISWISDGDTGLVSGLGTSSGWLPIGAYEAGAIPDSWPVIATIAGRRKSTTG